MKLGLNRNGVKIGRRGDQTGDLKPEAGRQLDGAALFGLLRSPETRSGAPLCCAGRLPPLVAAPRGAGPGEFGMWCAGAQKVFSRRRGFCGRWGAGCGRCGAIWPGG